MGLNAPTPYWRQDTIDLLGYARRHQISWSFNSYQPGGVFKVNSWTQPRTTLLRALSRGF